MQAYQCIFQRMENKYLLREEQYRMLMRRLPALFVEDVYGETQIRSLYFDTPDYRLIRQSMEKPAYKEKLRLRSYGIPQEETPVFLELKKKYRKIVYKRRAAMPYGVAGSWIRAVSRGEQAGIVLLPELEAESVPDSEAESRQIEEEIAYAFCFYPGLAPRMAITYDRTAYAGRDDPALRLTFDRNLRWQAHDLTLSAMGPGRLLLPENRILMEIKVTGGMPCELAAWLSEAGAYPVSFSKYGKAYLDMLRMQTMMKKGEVAYA